MFNNRAEFTIKTWYLTKQGFIPVTTRERIPVKQTLISQTKIINNLF